VRQPKAPDGLTDAAPLLRVSDGGCLATGGVELLLQRGGILRTLDRCDGLGGPILHL
jgi:hypothetical protein